MPKPDTNNCLVVVVFKADKDICEGEVRPCLAKLQKNHFMKICKKEDGVYCLSETKLTG